MMPAVITVGLLGVAVGLYRRIGMLWLFADPFDLLLVPTVRLFAGGAILAVLSTTAAWLVATHFKSGT